MSQEICLEESSLAPSELPRSNKATLQESNLYLRPNMIGWIIRPRNLEAFAVLDADNTGVRSQFRT